MSKQHPNGFTLLELLVALAVFSLVSVMAYSGLRTVLQSKQQTDQHAGRIQQLQSAVLLLERDLAQFVNRPVRDEYGETQPALKVADYGAIRLEFSRTGRRNPTGLSRSNLQRVAYGVEEDELHRYAWSVLDRAQDSEPYTAVMLKGVREFNLRFMDESREWHDQWPPAGLASGAPVPPPRALEFILVLDDLGAVRRIIPLFVEATQPSAPASGSGGGEGSS